MRRSLAINTKSVRFRTTVGAAVALVALLAVAGFAINWFVGRQVQQSFDAVLLEQATDRALLADQGATTESLITPVGREEVVAVIDAAGIQVTSVGLKDPQSVLELPLGVSTASLLIVEVGEGLEQEEMRVAVAEASTGLRVVVANEGEGASSTKSAVRAMLLGVIPLTALAGAAVAWFVTGRALEPVKTMRDELDVVVSASGGHRVTEPASGDEVGELGATINGVLNRLDEQSSSQRRFVADASHELKSPLANARAIIDTAAVEPDAVEYQRVTSLVGAELQRLHALVDDLLYLAQDDEGAPRNPRSMDIADVLFDECERVAGTSSKRVDASQVMPVSVIADQREATRAIRNLLENAERFAETVVTVSVAEAFGMATIVIADDGPGIPVADRERVFERFSRVDTDRARSAGGTGLGLSIVAALAARNGGGVRLTEAPSGGAQFELSFPTEQPNQIR